MTRKPEALAAPASAESVTIVDPPAEMALLERLLKEQRGGSP